MQGDLRSFTFRFRPMFCRCTYNQTLARSVHWRPPLVLFSSGTIHNQPWLQQWTPQTWPTNGADRTSVLKTTVFTRSDVTSSFTVLLRSVREGATGDEEIARRAKGPGGWNWTLMQMLTFGARKLKDKNALVLSEGVPSEQNKQLFSMEIRSCAEFAGC